MPDSPYDAPREDLDEDMPYPNRLAMLSAGRSASASSKTSGPSSAVINLRGSRPNSAAIAQEIEGFDDDFMVRAEGSCCWLRMTLW
jgi:histone deacetylase 6